MNGVIIRRVVAVRLLPIVRMMILANVQRADVREILPVRVRQVL